MDGVPVASDRSDLLAWATGAELDERMAALSLLSPSAPYTLVTRSWWQGVRLVTPGAYLQCDPDCSVREIRWWQPPAAALSLREGVPALREALCEAVSARTSRAGLISADLSGGLDSTSLCFISIRKAVPSLQLRTYVLETVDPSHEDVRWARQAAEHLGTPHRVLTVAEMPTVYDGLWPGEGVDDEWADLEQPYTVIRNRARKIFLARLLTETGSRLHIAGFGGDELFTPPPAYLHDLFRSNPALALCHLQSYRHLRRWPLAASMAALADRESYGHWVGRSARLLTLAYPATNTPNVGWGPHLRAPRWMSPRAVDMAAGLLMEAAETAEPLSPNRASHLTLSMLRTGGARLRLLDRLMRRCGTALSLPYMDDSVVEAALAINRREQGGAHRYKPLLRR